MKATCHLKILIHNGFELDVLGECSITGILPVGYIMFPTMAEGEYYEVADSYANADKGIWKPHIRLRAVQAESNWDELKQDISNLFLPGYILQLSGNGDKLPDGTPDWVRSIPPPK